MSDVIAGEVWKRMGFLFFRALVVFCFFLFSGAASAQAIVTTVAGTEGQFRGDGGPAIAANLYAPDAVTADALGNLYAASSRQGLVVRIDPAGKLTIVAGVPRIGGTIISSIWARETMLTSPSGVAVDGAGNLYFAEPTDGLVRKVRPDGTITVAAGGGPQTPVADGSSATDGSLEYPINVAVDAQGNLYVSEYYKGRVRKVDRNGTISTIAGGGTGSKDGVAATTIALSGPRGIVLDAAGNLYVAEEFRFVVRKIDTRSIATTVAGGNSSGSSGDGGPATSATLQRPIGLAVDRGGNLYIADANGHRVRKVTPNGLITTVASTGSQGFSGDGGQAGTAMLSLPSGVTIDVNGDLVVADTANSRLRRVSSSGVITTIAGTGNNNFYGDGGPAPEALFNSPSALVLSPAGGYYIADSDNSRIRFVDEAGIIRTVAGNGSFGFSGDGGPAVGASLSRPSGLALDRLGNLYIADTGNYRIRKVSPDGIIATIAGTGLSGSSGDSGPARQAALADPRNIAVDSAGALYVVDTHRIRKILPSGMIVAFAGTGSAGYSGDGGPALQAMLNRPWGLALDALDNLYIADAGNMRIRKVSRDGTISSVARFDLREPSVIALDAEGQLYVSYRGVPVVDSVSPDGTILRLSGQGGFGDGGLLSCSQFYSVAGLAVDAAGDLYLLDSGPARVRKILRSAPPPYPPLRLASLSPGGSYRRVTPLSVTITGTGFTCTMVTRWNGFQRPSRYISPTQMTITLDIDVLTAAGTGQITVSQGTPGGAVSNPLTFQIVPAPSVPPGGLVNAATFNGAPAPGSLASLFGENLAPLTGLASRLPLPYALEGAQAAMGRYSVPLLFVSPGQINLQIPWELAGETQVPLSFRIDPSSTTIPVMVRLSAPALEYSRQPKTAAARERSRFRARACWRRPWEVQALRVPHDEENGLRFLPLAWAM